MPRGMDGETIIIGALSLLPMLEAAIADAEEVRRVEQLPSETPFWLYVPEELSLPTHLPPTLVIKRVKSA
jgi:hypothetical protein